MFKKLNLDDFLSSKASLILIPETIMKLLHRISNWESEKGTDRVTSAHTKKKNQSISNRTRLGE